jgi:hypothetical protein
MLIVDSKLIIMEDQPYKVIDWKIVNIDHKKVSKLYIEKLGLEILLTHIKPFSQLTEFFWHNIFVILPVANYIHLFFKLPPNNNVPAIANITITNIKIYSESITKENERNNVRTIIFKDLILVIVFNGLKTLIALREFTEKFKFIIYGSMLVITIIKSKIFQ